LNPVFNMSSRQSIDWWYVSHTPDCYSPISRGEKIISGTTNLSL